MFHMSSASHIFAEDLKGLSKVWLLGDNFLVETYQKNFKKNNSFDFYLKSCFEVIPFCSSRFSDKNTNVISQLINSFVLAMNSKFYLPDYIIIVLDDNLIDYLQYRKFKVASLY